jgi:hypothetical protein
MSVYLNLGYNDEGGMPENLRLSYQTMNTNQIFMT